MTKPPPTDHFTKEASLAYDKKNSQLAPISENLHFLIRLMLRALPARTHVLCVGVGTGAEILSLSQAFPQWTFVGVDPSAAMLEVCRDRLTTAGVIGRCQLVQGYVHDVSGGENFDVALTIFVGHFVKHDEKLAFYKAMSDRLRTGGYLINAEISFDLDSEGFPSMLKNWEGVQAQMGATPESLAALPQLLRTALSIISPEKTESLLRESGISLPVRFFQAFMICGWYGIKK